MRRAPRDESRPERGSDERGDRDRLPTEDADTTFDT